MYQEGRMSGGERIYWPRVKSIDESGSLTIKVTGYEEDATHWTGWITLSPSEPDYDFWHWMAYVKQVADIVPERELDKWKSEYLSARSGMALSVR